MSFVSYAQNHEDVMLARVFRGLGAGFYIDVGAQDPRIDSVTKAFYEMGWSGINLEPVEAWCEKLREDRPRDTNLCLAAGDAEGEIDFHEVVDTGLSTSSEEFARRHQAQGHAVRTRKVRVRTLDAICAEQQVERVHFLKVDAEGDEAAVLRGIDLARLRPWVILVEATEPNSSVDTHAQWEGLVTGRGYDFVYDDGLNRFYLATEHAGLRSAFATPPNVFDDFIPRQILDHRNHEAGLAKHIAATEELAQLRAEAIGRFELMVAEKEQALVQHQDAIARAQAEIARARADIAEREAALAALREALAMRDARLQALQSELAERDASLASLRELVATQDAELRARKARLASLATRLQGSEQTVASVSRALLDSQSARQSAQAGWDAALADHRVTLDALAKAQADFQDIIASRSWRLTRPLRAVMTLAMQVRERLGLRARSPTQPVAALVPAAPTGADEPLQAQLPTLPPPPPPLPIGEDAERILARFPVLESPRANEDAR